MRALLCLTITLISLTGLSAFAGLDTSLRAVVKVISKGPPGSPELLSSGVFLRQDKLDLVVTTSHGIYHSNIVGQFFAQNSDGDRVSCRILDSSYAYDLTLLQCQASHWKMSFDLASSSDEDDYYRGGTTDYGHAVLAGYPANSDQLSVENSAGYPGAVFLKAPKEMVVPAVKAHYIAQSKLATEGMSGGILAVSDTTERWAFAGILSKKLPDRYHSLFRTSGEGVVGVIPASYVDYFVQTTLSRLKTGDLSPLMGNSQYTVFQDVNARLEHPLNVRVEQFSYAMDEVSIGTKNVKTIRVIPDRGAALQVTYSPYDGINEFKRILMRNPSCTLRFTAVWRGVNNGYKWVRSDFAPISTYEEALSYLILPNHERNWMPYNGLLLKVECPDQAKRLGRLAGLVNRYRKLAERFKKDGLSAPPHFDYVELIQRNILNASAEADFPMNFVLPMFAPRPCNDNSMQCQLQFQAWDLVNEMSYMLEDMYLKL